MCVRHDGLHVLMLCMCIQMTREHTAVVQGLETQIQGLQERISELHDEAFVREAQHQGQVEGLNRDLDLVDMHRLRGL